MSNHLILSFFSVGKFLHCVRAVLTKISLRNQIAKHQVVFMCQEKAFLKLSFHIPNWLTEITQCDICSLFTRISILVADSTKQYITPPPCLHSFPITKTEKIIYFCRVFPLVALQILILPANEINIDIQVLCNFIKWIFFIKNHRQTARTYFVIFVVKYNQTLKAVCV